MNFSHLPCLLAVPDLRVVFCSRGLWFFYCEFIFNVQLSIGASFSRVLEVALLSSFTFASAGIPWVWPDLEQFNNNTLAWSFMGGPCVRDSETHSASLTPEVIFPLRVTICYNSVPTSCEVFVFSFYQYSGLSFIFSLSSWRSFFSCLWTWICIQIVCCYIVVNIFIHLDCGWVVWMVFQCLLSPPYWLDIWRPRVVINMDIFYSHERSSVSHQK